MAAKHERNIQFQGDPQHIFERCKEILDQKPFRLKAFNDDSRQLAAKTRFSIWSWAEIVDVRVDLDGTVHIRSECSIPTQLIDYGKNKRNVRVFFDRLTGNI